MITPLDIQNKVFKKEFRGYSVQEVDEFLNQVIEGYEKLYRDNIDARDKITMLSETIAQYKNIEQTLQNTLVIAQSTGEQVQRNASEKASNIISEAENTAQKIINNAHEEIRKLTYKYDEMKRCADVYRAKMVSLLDSQLDILKSIKISDETIMELVGVNEALEILNEVKAEDEASKQAAEIKAEEAASKAEALI